MEKHFSIGSKDTVVKKVEGMHDIDTLRCWNNRVRIIGNINENPELLEVME